MSAYVVDWMSLLVRWLHLITGIAWIGASFYFVWLDNHLKPSGKSEDEERGVNGEVWSVHGGGFYHNEKFLLGPKGEPLTDNLHWFKWEAYWTWISGMLLLGIIYWYGATVYLIDRSVADLSVPAAIGISIAFLAVSWIAYDVVCRLVKNELALGALVAALIVFVDWALFQVFSARAAYIHVGAVIGTIMVANVFFVIIPGQKRTVASIRANQDPDPAPGQRAKQRSVHNTYLTLPVLFIMISNHFPMTYNHDQGWLVLVAIGVAGVLIRQFFILHHKDKIKMALPAAAVAVLAATAIAIMPKKVEVPEGTAAVAFSQVQSIIKERCNTCHAANPTDKIFLVAPGGMMFDTAEQINTTADKIYRRTVILKDMPLANMTKITNEERNSIAVWYKQQTRPAN